MGYHINSCVTVVTGTDRHHYTLEHTTVFTSHTQPRSVTHTERVRLYSGYYLLKGGYDNKASYHIMQTLYVCCVGVCALNNYQIRRI